MYRSLWARSCTPRLAPRTQVLELTGQLDARNSRPAPVVADGPDRVLGHVYLLRWTGLSIAVHIIKSSAITLIPLWGSETVSCLVRLHSGIR